MENLREKNRSATSWLNRQKKKPKAKAKPKAKPKTKARPTRKMECKQIMCKNDIKTRKEWQKWLLKNHPDKGGDEDIARLVNDCNDKKYYCKP